MRDFKNIKRVVIKIGTSTLALENGKLNIKRIKNIIKEISLLIDRGYQVIFVSSGAVGAGLGKLELDFKPKDIDSKRILAAVGQVELMHIYESLFFAHDKIIAQLLLTKDDFFGERLKNLSTLCNNLLEKGIIPIINENDAVVINEIKVGDNDTLSAMSCKIVGADLLIILSDIDGLYNKNPLENSDAKLISLVERVDDSIESLIYSSNSNLGTGGMKTKIEAAKIANEMGANMVIANGNNPSSISRIIKGEEIGTLFRVKAD